MLSGNDEITRLNNDVTTTMNLVVVSSRVLHVLTYANNPCRFTKLYTICRNMIEQFFTFTWRHFRFICADGVKGKWQVKLLLQNIYMYMIVALEVVYYHVCKCRKLALCYFIQINLILFCLTTICKSEMKQKVTRLKLTNTVILPILFYHVNSVVTVLSSQQPCNSLWYFYVCIYCP